MELKHLRYFVAAVEEGSIQAAAKHAHIAQPALSRRIRDLEAMLGCALLVRGARGVTPTRAGLAFYRDALAILESVGEAGQRARRLGLEQEREVRLGLVQTARKYGFLHHALATYAVDHPGAGVALTRASSRDLATAVREGRLDATLLYEQRIGSARFGERLIHKERYILAVHPAHRLARPGPAELRELSGEPLVWVFRQDTANNHDPLFEQCRRHGLEPVIGQWANSPEGLVDLVMVSGGACITPASSILALPSGHLHFRALPDFDMELDLRVGWNKASITVAVQDFLAGLHRAIDLHQADILEGRAEWAHLDGLPLFRIGKD